MTVNVTVFVYELEPWTVIVTVAFPTAAVRGTFQALISVPDPFTRERKTTGLPVLYRITMLTTLSVDASTEIFSVRPRATRGEATCTATAGCGATSVGAGVGTAAGGGGGPPHFAQLGGGGGGVAPDVCDWAAASAEASQISTPRQPQARAMRPLTRPSGYRRS